MSNVDLPMPDRESFIGEHEVMNLDALKEKLFMVAINSGDRDDGHFICKTAHGPYTFSEMCEEVGGMWREHQHHSKVLILEKDSTKLPRWLDECVIDYVEAKYLDIITEVFLGDMEKEYTCQARIIQADPTDDPRHKKDEE